MGDLITRGEAESRGLSRYFTGKPCPHGHSGERYVAGRECVECKLASVKTRNKTPAYRAKRREQTRRRKLKNRDKERARLRLKNKARRAAEGRFTEGDIERIRKAQKGRCAICRTPLSKTTIAIDHIIPIKLGGTSWPANIQLLCNPCNQSKGPKHPIEFARSKGLLL